MQNFNMDPPAVAVDLPTVSSNRNWWPTLQRERRERGQSSHSRSHRMSRQLLFMVGFVIITLLKLEPMTQNSVPTHNSIIVLPNMKMLPPDLQHQTGIKVSSATKAKVRTSSHDSPQSKSKCIPPTVAIMIAGQFGRFVFRDNLDPLITSSSATWYGCGEPVVDVYIALHRGRLTKPYQGEVSAPPYINDNVTIADIQKYYLENRNATNVHILFVDDEHMSKVHKDTARQVTAAQNIPSKARELFQNEFKPGRKLFSNARMLYMCLLAYTMTMTSQDQKKYDIYVRLREDNLFYEPLNLDSANLLELEAAGQPRVIIEKWCKWKGAPSDKIHIGNQLGMSTLYGNNRNDYFGLMIRYAVFGYERSSLSSISSSDRFQTESFLQSLLAGAGANVSEVDLKRFDLRYIGESRCVPHIYYKCQPESAKLVLFEKFGIVSCNTILYGHTFVSL